MSIPSQSQARAYTAGCAARAQLRGDPLVGTAFPASRVLMVEQPGPWGSAGLSESRFDPRVAIELERTAGSAGIRVLAVRRVGRSTPGAPRRWAYADCRPGRQSLVTGTYVEDAELLGLPLDGTLGGRTVSGPAFLVCAHSKHDACCAMKGRPVAAALAAVRPGRVWESSHLGGDRFAANVLVVPSGLLYGRVLPDAAQEFVDAADRGEVLTPWLRGRVGFRPVVQAALAYAHEQLMLIHLDELGLIDVHASEAGTVVRLSTPQGPVDVTVSVTRSAPETLTCQATAPSRYLIHQPLGIDRVV